MPVTWKIRISPPDQLPEEWVEDGETHIGLVMGEPYTREGGVGEEVFVRVWNSAKSLPEELPLCSFEGVPRVGHPVVDIDPEILSSWVLRKEATEAEQTRRSEERVAELELRKLRKGVEAIVVSGRKVKKGTKGVIIWIGSGEADGRVGLKDPTTETVNWTSASNIEVLVPGVPQGQSPEGGWKKLWDQTKELTTKWQETFPEKGDHVRVLATGLEGIVFWRKEERLGITKSGSTKGEEPLWCNAWEVVILDASGNVLGQVKEKPEDLLLPLNSGVAVGGSITLTGGVGGAGGSITLTAGMGGSSQAYYPPPKKSKRNPLSHLPHPFDLIRSIIPPDHSGGNWKALSEEGVTLVKLTEEGAQEILLLLENES